MTFGYRDGIAVLQLIIFIPAAPLSLLLCIRHGFSKSSGWRFLLVFSLFRIAGAIAELISISQPTVPVYTTILVCNSVGISPLNLLIVGLLSRLNDQLVHKIPPRIFKVVEIVSLAGLILAIYAGAGVKQTGTTYGTNPYSKASVLIFLTVYICSVGLYLVVLTRMSQIMSGERRMLVAIGIACPLILARLIYSIVYDFGAGIFWSSTFGNATLYLCMAVLEEIGVVVTCLGIGLTLKKLPKAVVTHNVDEEMQLHEQGGKGPESRHARQHRRKPRGPIGLLFYYIREGVEHARNKNESR